MLKSTTRIRNETGNAIVLECVANNIRMTWLARTIKPYGHIDVSSKEGFLRTWDWGATTCFTYKVHRKGDTSTGDLLIMPVTVYDCDEISIIPNNENEKDSEKMELKYKPANGSDFERLGIVRRVRDLFHTKQDENKKKNQELPTFLTPRKDGINNNAMCV